MFELFCAVFGELFVVLNRMVDQNEPGATAAVQVDKL